VSGIDPEKLKARLKHILDDIDAVDQLIEETTPKPKSRLSKFNQACLHGDLVTVARLLDGGRDPLQRKQRQGTPLGFAAEGGHLEIVKLLLDAGVDPEARSRGQTTALHSAVQEGHLEVVRELLARGARPNLVNDAGEPPLLHAASEGNLAIVEVLLEAGADPNLGGDHECGTSALDAAIGRVDPDMILLMLDYGADMQRGQYEPSTVNDSLLKSPRLAKRLEGMQLREGYDESHVHVCDLEGEQSPECPFCGGDAWERQTWREHQEECREETECKHEVYRTNWGRRDDTYGPLSQSESTQAAFLPEPRAAAIRLRGAVHRLRDYAEQKGLDPALLVQDALGTLPVWWDWHERSLDESIQWVLAGCTLLRSRTFCYEDARFMGIGIDEVFYAEDPAAVRLHFHDTLSADATVLEHWVHRKVFCSDEDEEANSG
jgi:hypothetical protein